MQWGTRAFNRRLALALGALVFGLLATGSLRLSLSAFFFHGLFWLYLVGVALLVEWLVLWRTRRGAPELPLGPASWTGNRRVLAALVIWVAAFTLLREGALSPYAQVSFSRHRSTTLASREIQGQTSPNGPIAFAGRPARCAISCRGSNTLCSALRDQLRCAGDGLSPLNSRGAVVVSIDLSFGSAPFCYTPLVKSGTLTFEANVTASTASNGATKEGSLTLHGRVQQQMYGFASCREFTEAMAVAAASQTREALSEFLGQN